MSHLGTCESFIWFKFESNLEASQVPSPSRHITGHSGDETFQLGFYLANQTYNTQDKHKKPKQLNPRKPNQPRFSRLSWHPARKWIWSILTNKNSSQSLMGQKSITSYLLKPNKNCLNWYWWNNSVLSVTALTILALQESAAFCPVLKPYQFGSMCEVLMKKYRSKNISSKIDKA